MSYEKTTEETGKQQMVSDVWLPPARELAEYPQAFVESIIKMAETQQLHRHELEEKALQANIALRKSEISLEARGQSFGFCIGIIALLIGAVLGWKGSQIAASVIGGGGVIGLVTAFLRGGAAASAPRLDAKKDEQRRHPQPSSAT